MNDYNSTYSTYSYLLLITLHILSYYPIPSCSIPFNNLFTWVVWTQADFMLPDQSSRVLLELNRREQYLRSKQEKEKSPDDDTDKDAKHKGKARGTGDKNVGDKWKSMHMELAEQRSLSDNLQLITIE